MRLFGRGLDRASFAVVQKAEARGLAGFGDHLRARFRRNNFDRCR